MKKLSVVIFLVTLTAILLETTHFAQAEIPFSCDPGFGSLPSNDPAYPANQLILICKPASWNGDLIVYAHGYVPIEEPLALPLDELTWRFPRLSAQPRLLLADPAEPGHRVGPGHLQAGASRRDQRHAACWRIHGQVDVLDLLARHSDGDLAQMDRLGHQ